MLISQNGETEKQDNAKMNSFDLNNGGEFKEKSNSLNALKFKNINNLIPSQSYCEDEKKVFCNNELKKHISLLRKYS